MCYLGRNMLAVALLQCFVVAVGVVIAIPVDAACAVPAEVVVLDVAAAIAFDLATTGGAALLDILADVVALVLAVVVVVALGGFEIGVGRQSPASIAVARIVAAVDSPDSASVVAR